MLKVKVRTPKQLNTTALALNIFSYIFKLGPILFQTAQHKGRVNAVHTSIKL